jgi:phospholipid/cholesterol/gamma-HCH transport system permease protein
MLLVMPLMSSIAVVLGTVAGAAVAGLDPDVRFGYFLSAALRSTTLPDFLSGAIKTLFFAYNIAIVACHLGLRTRGGTEGVGRSTTETVVVTSVITLVADFFLTKLFLAIGWQ